MANDITNLDDHRLLSYEAAREGLNYRDYRRMLDLHQIPLGTAIENVRTGISIHDYLRQRHQSIRKTKLAIGAMIGFSVMSLFYSIANPTTTRYERARNQYQETQTNDRNLEEGLQNLEQEELFTFGFSRT